MTTVQAVFAAAVAAGTAAIGWFAVLVFARTIKAGSARDLCRAVKRAVTGRHLVDRGQLAFCCHRVSGVAVFAFLCLHIVNVGVISVSPESYDQILAVYGSAPMRVMESVLLLALLFHALNGLRLMAVDLLVLATRTADRLLSWVFALTLLAGLCGACVILLPLLS